MAGLEGSEGDRGCESGDGAMRRDGSGPFDAAGEVPVVLRTGVESWRDCTTVSTLMETIRCGMLTEGLLDAFDEMLPELLCLS